MRRLGDAVSAFRSGKGLKGQLLRGGVGSLAVKLGSTLLNVLLAVVLARTLGAEGFGIYSFVFALITILAIPAQMGLPNLVVRETAKAQANGDWALMKGLWRWSTLMALAMSLALMAIGALAAWLFASRLPDGGLAVFYWGLVLVPLVALGNLRGAALRGLRHVVKGQLPEFILRPAFLILLVLGAHFGLSARALTASDAMMLHALASLVTFAIGAWLLLRARPGEMRSESQFASHPRLWLRSALPLGVISGMQLINQNIGLVVLGAFANTEDVGYFRIAQQAASLVVLGLTAINLTASPHFARLYVLGDFYRLQKLVTLTARIGFAAAIPVFLLFVFLGKEALAFLFGSAFDKAYPALVLITCGQAANAFTGPVSSLLTMTGHERDVFWSMGLSALVNVALTLALVATIGLIGAAIASTISLIIWNLILVVRGRLRLGIDSTSIGPKKIDKSY